MSAFGSRAARIAAVAALAPTLHACFEYRPLTTTTPPLGRSVALQITDQGRVTLSERFGPGLAEIQGRVVGNEGNEYVVNVFRVSQINGESAAWSGEETRIDRLFVGTIKGRTFSPVRTALFSLASGTALYFLVGRRLIGSFTGGHEGDPPPPPLSNRIPLPVRF